MCCSGPIVIRMGRPDQREGESKRTSSQSGEVMYVRQSQGDPLSHINESEQAKVGIESHKPMLQGRIPTQLIQIHSNR